LFLGSEFIKKVMKHLLDYSDLNKATRAQSPELKDDQAADSAHVSVLLVQEALHFLLAFQ
jgi:hypothetical protein